MHTGNFCRPTDNSPHFGAGLTFKWEPPVDALRDEAVAVAKRSDVIVAFLGLSPEIEGEEMPVHLEGFNGEIAPPSNCHSWLRS